MLKRLFDVLVSIVTLLLLSPVMLVLCVLIRQFLGGPIFFKQQRPGLHGEPFYMVKFRSMTNECDADGELLSDADRLTRFGSFLRKTSLDELPGLINVLNGNMSLVGPRPLLMSYLPLYSEQQKRRHDVLPGVTGWAQVKGRNALSWNEKFTLDVWYVDNQSFILDIKILFLTVYTVLGRKNISADGEVTMTPFLGNKKH